MEASKIDRNQRNNLICFKTRNRWKTGKRSKNAL